MPLSTGQRIGSYEIVSPIGAGGMGEVYRARDSRLKRDVAIKVLPADVAADRERLARFQREAEVLASLNHPHIAHVYGIEDNALVMELVDGEDLSQRIARGAIPLDEALPIAKQIAEALEAAHDAGIIHRDLKPANVKVRDDGTVKVLDFGLAKNQGSGIGDQGSGGLENSPTITSPAMTMRGVILGTAAYMAPEQAKGRAVDRRADIWAFGCVLYEMLTGTRAFKGDDVTDIITAVMRDTPDWSALPATTPVAIRRLLHRCLEKDPRKRIAHLSIARLEIDEAMSPTGELVSQPPPRAEAQRRSLLPLIAATGTVLALAVGWASGRYFTTPAPADAPLLQFDLGAPEKTQLFRRNVGTFAMAPDGESVVYAAVDATGTQKLWLHSFRDGTSRELPNTSLAVQPFWSPDGRFVGFQAQGKLQRIDVRSGNVNVICECPGGRGTWNSDNVILFSARAIMRVPASGGTPEPITQIDDQAGEARHIRPLFLPDGRHFIFSTVNTERAKDELRIGELGSRQTRVLDNISNSAEYLAPGYLVYAVANGLVARPFDAGTGKWSGEPIVISNKVRAQSIGGGAFSVSPRGTLVYDSTDLNGETELTWLDRSGRSLGLFGRINGFHTMSLSADERVAAIELIDARNSSIWLADAVRGTRTRFTFDPASSGAQGHPVWSPDMKQIAYFVGAPGTVTRLMVKDASNTRDAEPLIANDDNRNTRQATDWSTDGRILVFEEQTPTNNYDLRYLRLDGDRRPIDIVHSPFSDRQGRLSPNGKYLAYTSTESGRDEVFVVTFPDASQRWPISTNGGNVPVWRHDGRELFFIDSQDVLMSVAFAPGNEFRADVPKPLFTLNSTTSDGTNYAVARDGRFLVARPAERDGSTLKVIVNLPRLLESLSKQP